MQEHNMANAPVIWWEIASADMHKTVEFLRAVADWVIEYDEHAGYYIIPAEGGNMNMRGGEVFNPRPGRVTRTTIYIQVDRIDERVEKAKQLGGEVYAGPVDGESGVRLYVLTDPVGSYIGLMQPDYAAGKQGG
jgi:predicted enzyme related to lactoylglutathione lyase